MTHSLSISTRPCTLSSQRHFSFQPSQLFFISILSCGHTGDLVSTEAPSPCAGHPFALLPGAGLRPSANKTQQKKPCINGAFQVETRLLFCCKVQALPLRDFCLPLALQCAEESWRGSAEEGERQSARVSGWYLPCASQRRLFP